MKKECGSVIGWAIVAALAAFVAVAGTATAQNSIPFQDSFEGYADGQTIIGGAKGWEADNASYAVATNYTYSYASWPLAGENHDRVVVLNTEGGGVSNTFAQADLTNVWIDMMVQLVEWGQDENPPVVTNDTSVQTAIYLATNGMLRIYHAVSEDWSTFSNVWTELSHPAIASGSWHRVTITLDYKSSGVYNTRFFKIQLDGEAAFTDDHAWVNPANPFAGQGGEWFLCANNADINPYLSAAVFSGTGYLDDFVVTDSKPTFAKAWAINASVDPAAKGSISPSGDMQVADGGNETFNITVSDNWRIVDVLVNDVSVGATNQYVWDPVTNGGTIVAKLDYVRVANNVPVQWLLDNGLDPIDGANDNEDEDNDGYANWKEHAFSTDPNDADSYPKIVAETSGGTTTVRWVGVAVDPYAPPFKVYRRSSMTEGDWEHVDNVNRAEGENTFADEPESFPMFYRVTGESKATP